MILSLVGGLEITMVTMSHSLWNKVLDAVCVVNPRWSASVQPPSWFAVVSTGQWAEGTQVLSPACFCLAWVFSLSASSQFSLCRILFIIGLKPMPGESYCSWLWCFVLLQIFWALIKSFVCWFIMGLQHSVYFFFSVKCQFFSSFFFFFFPGWGLTFLLLLLLSESRWGCFWCVGSWRGHGHDGSKSGWQWPAK